MQIELSNISFRFKGSNTDLFRIADAALSTGGVGGAFTCIVGPTGCGKSTLLRLLNGENTNGVVSGALVMPKLKKAYLPQKAIIFPRMTATQNAQYFATLESWRTERESILNEIEKLGALLRIDWERLDSMPSERWSGGERQRISIIRALSVKCDILLMDEPCSGLDVETRFHLLAFLRREVYSRGIHAIYVTHHGDEVLWVADQLLSFSGTGDFFEVGLQSLAEALDSPQCEVARMSLNLPLTFGGSDNTSSVVSRLDLRNGISLLNFDDGSREIRTSSL